MPNAAGALIPEEYRIRRGSLLQELEGAAPDDATVFRLNLALHLAAYHPESEVPTVGPDTTPGDVCGGVGDPAPDRVCE